MSSADEDPAELRRQVTSPGGTTEAALKVLQGAGGLDALLIAAVDAAVARAKALVHPQPVDVDVQPCRRRPNRYRSRRMDRTSEPRRQGGQHQAAHPDRHGHAQRRNGERQHNRRQGERHLEPGRPKHHDDPPRDTDDCDDVAAA